MQETKFRPGQTVWCLLYGKGEVIETVSWDDDVYSVEVHFEDIGESVFYTQDGCYLSGTNRTLFFSEPQVIAETEPVFEPKLVGKVVVVHFNGKPVHAGKVTSEDNEKVITLDYVWLKRSYMFYEVSAQPITFD